MIVGGNNTIYEAYLTVAVIRTRSSGIFSTYSSGTEHDSGSADVITLGMTCGASSRNRFWARRISFRVKKVQSWNDIRKKCSQELSYPKDESWIHKRWTKRYVTISAVCTYVRCVCVHVHTYIRVRACVFVRQHACVWNVGDPFPDAPYGTAIFITQRVWSVQ